jgi:hypothetical protein
VWLFQSLLDGSCADYQLLLDISESDVPFTAASDSSSTTCAALDMPHNLNTARYLGELKSGGHQSSFHYLENFRVDNMFNSTSHEINFELQEPTLMRVVGLVHKHRIDFDIELHSVDTDSKIV